MNHVRSSEICLCTCLLLLIIDRYCSELMYDWSVSYSQRAPLGIDKQDLRASLDNEVLFPLPDGILINGLGPNRARFEFEPGEIIMGWGLWDESKKAGYNMVDAVSRSTIQELYLRVKGAWEDEQSDISTRDEAPIPANVIKCGRAANL
ncbi:hypothetical protein V6N13_139115 [Hibiscus sabdariffa]